MLQNFRISGLRSRSQLRHRHLSVQRDRYRQDLRAPRACDRLDLRVNAGSTSITAPSVTIPNGHNADRFIALFASDGIATSLPVAITQEWHFHAIGYGLIIALGDTNLTNSA